MRPSYTMRTPADAPSVAEALLKAFPEARVFALQGELGAGKTTLIKGFCVTLGVESRTSSPSFAIVNEYRSANGATVYHFDLYRLEGIGELEAIGFSEYLGSGSHCFIEWPELAEALLPEDVVTLRIDEGSDGSRIVHATRRMDP